MIDFVSRLENVRGKMLIAAALVACLAATALAELPPFAYKEMQAESPERLTIKIKSVKTTERDERDRKRVDVTIDAKVTEVARTSSRLKPGQSILIRYTRSEYKQPIAGPSEVPLLREGATYPAFLSRTGKTGRLYAPAAGGYSFKVVD